MAINKYVIFSLLLALTALACTETAPVARVNVTPEGNGKLYLNLNKDVQGLWMKDMQEYIRKADVNWPRMLGEKRRP